MTTKDIRTSHAHTVVCDVCGRTLLRGELADIYIAGSDRRSVCELCKPRALHEGWVREGTLPEYDRAATGADRRRGLLARLRQHLRGRDRGTADRPTLDDELSGRAWDPAEPGPAWNKVASGNGWNQAASGNGWNQAASGNGWDQSGAAAERDRPGEATVPDRFGRAIEFDQTGAAAYWDEAGTPHGLLDRQADGFLDRQPDGSEHRQPDGSEDRQADELRSGPESLDTRIDLSEPPPGERVRRPRSTRESSGDERRPARPARRGRRRPGNLSAKERRSPLREPRHVRAVPSSHEQKVAAAVKLFNQSEHRRTVAGVAKSLGGPCVSVLPAGEPPSFVRIVISWELCWYRYAVDLADELPSVRVDGQGSELSELTAEERTATARADDTGQLLIP